MSNSSRVLARPGQSLANPLARSAGREMVYRARPGDGQVVAEEGGIVRAVMAVVFPALTDVEGSRPVVVVHDPQSCRGDPLGLPRLNACVVEPGADALTEAAGIDVEAVQLGGDPSILVRDGARADHRESFQPIAFAGAEHDVTGGGDIAAQHDAVVSGAHRIGEFFLGDEAAMVGGAGAGVEIGDGIEVSGGGLRMDAGRSLMAGRVRVASSPARRSIS